MLLGCASEARVNKLEILRGVIKYVMHYDTNGFNVQKIQRKNIIAELSRARSGAPWVRKFGKLSIRQNLVMT